MSRFDGSGDGADGSGVSPHRPTSYRRFRAWFDRNRPQIALVTLAITIPELLTGSTFVTSLVNPLAVAGLLGFYGAGSLLIREASLRWRNGWGGVLLLGLAYGIAEEGIATKTMVDPASSAAGFLGTYGHFLGVNWVFAVVIALFHALYSIALPILLVELIYPSTRGVRFLTDRGAKWTLGILGLSVTLGYFGFDPHYFEGYAVLGLLLVVMALFVLAARWVPSRWLWPRTAQPRVSPRALGLVGGTFAVAWSLFYLLAPHLLPLPALVVAGELGASLLVLFLVLRWAGREGNELHKVYFAAGLLAWYVPWDFIVIFLGDYLVPLVLGLVLYLLYRLSRRWGTAADRPAVVEIPPHVG